MPGPYTRLELVTQVSEELQDTTNVYFTVAKIREFINEGMAEFCERTKIRRETTTINVTANDATIDLTSTAPKVLEVLRVALPSSEGATDEMELRHLTLEELEDQDSNWRNTRGQPWAYLRWDQGHDLIRLYPEPDTAFTAFARSNGVWSYDSMYGDIDAIVGLSDATFDSMYGAIQSASQKYGAVRVDYIAASTNLAADSDTPLGKSDIPAQYHHAFRIYACMRCLRMETSLRQIERSDKYQIEWEKIIEKAMTESRSEFQLDKPVRRVRMIR